MAGEVETKVREIISEQLGVAADEVTPEASFIEDLGADSLDIVELVMALEEEYRMEISDEDAEKIRTVKDVVTYIEGAQGLSVATHLHFQSLRTAPRHRPWQDARASRRVNSRRSRTPFSAYDRTMRGRGCARPRWRARLTS